MILWFYDFKPTVQYDGLAYIAFVMFALKIPCTTLEIMWKFTNWILLHWKSKTQSYRVYSLFSSSDLQENT